MKGELLNVVDGLCLFIGQLTANPRAARERLGKFFRNLPITLRQPLIRFQDRFGAYAEALLVVMVGSVLAGILAIFGFGSVSDWVIIFGSFAAAAVTTFCVRSAYRQHAILIEVTMSYLIHGGRSFLDNLLGKLIGGTWRRQQIKPGDALFGVLREIARGDDWEMKRRVAEALPTLGAIDARRTTDIVGILREEWEPRRWRSDLRRRAVEGLMIPPLTGGTPLLNHIKPELVRPLLQLREKDEIYVAIAIVEALSCWEDTRPKLTEELRRDLFESAAAVFTPDENQALEELGTLLRTAKGVSIVAAKQRIEEMSKSLNAVVRIAAARNVLMLSQRYPDTTLDLMLEFLDPNQHRNVRRPMARERAVNFIISMLASPNHKSKAETILRKLASDPDEIVRVTTFDMAEKLREKDPQVVLAMCQQVLNNRDRETSPSLLERAERIRQELPVSTNKGT